MQRSKNYNKHSASVAGKSSFDGRCYWRDELDFDGGKRYIRRRVRRLERVAWKKEQVDDIS